MYSSLVASSLEESESVEHTVLKEGIAKLAPGERTLAVQNSQFLQENSSRDVAVLAAARTSKRLESTTAEIEDTVQMLLQENVHLSPKVIKQSCCANVFLTSMTGRFRSIEFLGGDTIRKSVGIPTRLPTEGTTCNHHSF